MSLAAATGSEAFGCDTYFLNSIVPPGNYEKHPSGMSSCTAYDPGTTIDNSHLVPAPGTITTVRVKSGVNPAPLKITIIKRIFQTNPNPPYQITDAQCCTGTGRESAAFQPAPNAVSEVVVNLPVTTTPSVNGASGHSDIVSVSAVGPGDLPIASLGDHSFNAPYNAPAMEMFYPKVETGLQGQNKYDYINYSVLMNFDWTDGCASTANKAVKVSACTPPPPVAVPASVASKSLRLKKGKIAIKVSCTAPAGCKGKLKLSTATKKPRLLASKSINVAGGKTKTVKLKLSAKARKRLKKKTTKVSVEVDLGAAGRATKALTLKR